MKTVLWNCIIVIAALFLLCGCAGWYGYDEQKIIGKTSDEIIALYGESDQQGAPPSADGLYRNTRASYYVIEPKVGYLGTDPGRLFSICFDENGIAYDCLLERGGVGG